MQDSVKDIMLGLLSSLQVSCDHNGSLVHMMNNLFFHLKEEALPVWHWPSGAFCGTLEAPQLKCKLGHYVSHKAGGLPVPKQQQSLHGDFGESLVSSESFRFSGKLFLAVGCSE